MKVLKEILKDKEVWFMLIGLILMLVLVGCSSPRTDEYYKARDLAVVNVLDLCRYQEITVLREGSTVKDLAVGFVDSNHKLQRCIVVVEESVALIGENSKMK